MGMNATGTELLAAVERSPRAAGARDRDGWVGLFAADATIEDPVGSRPHRGPVQIERFYDTFIAPRDITFHSRTDVVAASTVVRDVTLEVSMGASVTLSIPAFLRYDLDDELRIRRLQAFWELPAMARQFASNGTAALPAGAELARALLRNQGRSGAAGFLTGFGGLGSGAKGLLGALLDDACAGDEIAVRRRLPDTVELTTGDAHRIGTSDLAALLRGARWDGMVRAGRHVATSVEREGLRGVVFGEVGMPPTPSGRSRLAQRREIRAVRVFAEDGWT